MFPRTPKLFMLKHRISIYRLIFKVSYSNYSKHRCDHLIYHAIMNVPSHECIFFLYRIFTAHFLKLTSLVLVLIDSPWESCLGVPPMVFDELFCGGVWLSSTWKSLWFWPIFLYSLFSFVSNFLEILWILKKFSIWNCKEDEISNHLDILWIIGY